MLLFGSSAELSDFSSARYDKAEETDSPTAGTVNWLHLSISMKNIIQPSNTI